jgi:hypothetical protein
MPRSLTMPKWSSQLSHSSASAMSVVRRPSVQTSPSSGTEAPVTRFTSISAPGASTPPIEMRSPGPTISEATRSGRSPW